MYANKRRKHTKGPLLYAYSYYYIKYETYFVRARSIDGAFVE